MSVSTDNDWVISTERTREESFLTPYDWSWTDAAGSLNTGTVHNTGLTVKFSDNETLGWKHRIKQGEVIMNDMERKEDTIINDKVNAYFTTSKISTGGSTVSMIGTCSSDYIIDTPDTINMPNGANVDNVRARALDMAYAKAQDSEALLLATIAEGHKTVKLFYNLMKRVVRMTEASVRLKKKLVKGLLTPQEASKVWLEYRYGWRPILFDARNFIKGLGAVAQKRRLRFYGYAEETDTPYPVFFTEGKYRHQVHLVDRRRHHVEARAGVLVEWDNPYKDYSDTLGLNRLIDTAWELVPYSFIVDWFLNTADYISARTLREFKVRGSFCTVTQTQETTREIVSVENTDGLWNTTAYYPGARTGRVVMTRSRYANPPLGIFPQINIRLDVSKIADIVSLLKNAAYYR